MRLPSKPDQIQAFAVVVRFDQMCIVCHSRADIKCGNMAFLTYKLNWNSSATINKNINLDKVSLTTVQFKVAH